MFRKEEKTLPLFSEKIIEKLTARFRSDCQ